MTPDQSLTQGLQFLTRWSLVVILPLLGVGALSMALIQTAKNMLPLRRWFQRNRVENWLAARAHSPLAAPEAINLSEAKTDLVHVSTAGDANAFYALPIEQLCGQINAAMQVILDYPARHWDLLRCLASQSKPADLAAINPPDPAIQSARKALLRKPAVTLTNDEHNQVDELVAARNRVSHQIQRAVDSLQISVGFRWKFWMQLTSILASAVLAAAALAISGRHLNSSHSVCFIALAAIFSGLLAPVARDLVAAIEQTRT
ncbi:MAG: hypothetical protein WA020_06925 [Candidatus Acidiferrales bacterium]